MSTGVAVTERGKPTGGGIVKGDRPYGLVGPPQKSASGGRVVRPPPAGDAGTWPSVATGPRTRVRKVALRPARGCPLSPGYSLSAPLSSIPETPWMRIRSGRSPPTHLGLILRGEKGGP